MFCHSSKLLCILASAFIVINFNCAGDRITRQQLKKLAQGKINLDDSRITNGKDVNIKQFPHIVQLLDKYNSLFFCGGTIISELHVVTAAHCLDNYQDPDDIVIMANVTYLQQEGMRREVEFSLSHPQYNKTTWDNDIAIMKLSEPLIFGDGVQPAALCPETWQDDEKVIVLGWGQTSEGVQDQMQHLQYVCLKTLSTVECMKLRKHVTENMSCALVQNGQDACQSDSGGPALYYGKLCGVISFGYGCGREGRPAVFAQIPLFRDFILKAMEK